MTDLLEGVTDAHLQAALDAAPKGMVRPEHIRLVSEGWEATIAHARTIAANEKKGEAMRLLAAELAEERLQNATLRAKLEAALAGEPEPAPVDPVEAEVVEICRARGIISNSDWADMIEIGLRRGMEMQPAPFTREDAQELAVQIAAKHGTNNRETRRSLVTALTTPHAELRAMLGDG